MPEGPECHVLTDSLRELIDGKKLVDFNVLRGRYNETGITNSANLKGHHVKKVECKGKLICIYIGHYCLFITLGMTGTFTTIQDNHCQVSMDFDEITIYYRDPRHMGTLRVARNMDEINNILHSRGPDLLTQDIGIKEFANILRRVNNKNICIVLMDQKYVSGIGNYLKAEILYRCKISPWKNVKELTDDQLENIYTISRVLLKKSYKKGGASIYTFENSLINVKGRFTQNFRVYNKDKDSHGYVVIRDETPDKRVTHWVPEVQK